MKSVLKKGAATLLVLTLAITLLMSAGCSTPRVAMTVDGDEYTTGEYLANLYNAFYRVYVDQSLYYYDLYGGDSYDVWGETYTYDDETEYDLAGYITRIAQECIVRQTAVKRLMSKYNVTLSAEDEEAYKAHMESLPAGAYIDYGFSNESYGKMYREYTFNEQTLLRALYDAGGQKGVTAEEIRSFFEENFFSYEIISYSLIDDEGNALSEEEISEIDKSLDGYMAQYTESGDFNAVIDQKAKDDAAKEAAESEDADDTNDTDTEENTPSTLADNRVDVVAEESDEEFIAALKEMAFNEAKIIEYKTDDDISMKSLVLRLDPEADRGEDEDGNAIDYYTEQHDAIIYYMSFDKLDEEIQGVVDTLEVVKNNRAIKACDPYDFRAMLQG